MPVGTNSVMLWQVGECDDDSDLNLDSVVHKCWKAWRYVFDYPGQPSGQVLTPPPQPPVCTGFLNAWLSVMLRLCLSGLRLCLRQVSFQIADYKAAGDYELRYFYGDSSGGQGYSCVTLGNVGETYKHCLLRARATSSVVSVVITGRGDMAQSMPGLQEHYCDGGDGLCTW